MANFLPLLPFSFTLSLSSTLLSALAAVTCHLQLQLNWPKNHRVRTVASARSIAPAWLANSLQHKNLTKLLAQLGFQFRFRFPKFFPPESRTITSSFLPLSLSHIRCVSFFLFFFYFFFCISCLKFPRTSTLLVGWQFDAVAAIYHRMLLYILLDISFLLASSFVPKGVGQGRVELGGKKGVWLGASCDFSILLWIRSFCASNCTHTLSISVCPLLCIPFIPF